MEMSMNLYDYAVYYLKKHTVGLTDSILNEYFKVNKAESLDEAFKRGVASVNDNNRRTMANPIAYFKPDRKAAIDKVLCGLSLNAVRAKYGDDVNKLWNDFCTQVVPNSEQSPRGAWYKFAENIITLVAYLSEFRDIDELYAVFEKAQSVEEKINLINTVSAKVKWWGFAMASNWIKDMGMTEFCKPDQHVRAIINGIYQTGENEKKIFAKVIEIAKKCNVSPFVLDRVLFLVGSGDFYGQGHEHIKKSYNGNEQDFIYSFKTHLKSGITQNSNLNP